ncbi:MAG: MarR family transcriptional regulator [Rubrivivax sp.]
MRFDVSRRFGFLAAEVAKLYGELFDAAARDRIGLSRAQCRLLVALAGQGDGPPLSQAELAQRLDLTPMAVAMLCDRMEAAQWVQRQPSASDRRVKNVVMAAQAEEALRAAMRLGDAITSAALKDFSAEERAQLVALLGKAREGLLRQFEAPPREEKEAGRTEGARP